jgi:hypothetical protein
MSLTDINPIPDWEMRLKTVVELLSEALKTGYSIGSSPVEPLIEVMVDLALQVKNSLQEGLVSWELRSNKILKFSKTEIDALSNPKVLSSEVERHRAWDPLLSNFFGKIATDLIVVKQTHKLPENLYSSSKRGDQDRHPGQQKINTAVYQFHRRQSRRVRRN